MEKIKVNMTPIEEVKTIHASQNDNATRKWAFDLYDENGKIDSSDIKEQMIFDSKVGGTEQILPENTSDPTTSPIIADIQYPDSLRSEQTFLYRESPTAEDGQAKITRIKGNTVVFNQLVQNGNFADTSGWNATTGISFSVSNNVATVKNTDGGNRYISRPLSMNVGHKYLLLLDGYKEANSNSYVQIFYGEGSDYALLAVNVNSFQQITTSFICASNTYNTIRLIVQSQNASSYFKNVMLIDLTQLNNSAITDASSFRSHYNLPYYAYTTGKLLPFLGEELKTTNADETETNVLSLPTLTYFPSGMKSAGSVYDEQLPYKATTRVGSITFDGTQSITSSSISSSRCKAFFEAPNVAPNTSSSVIDYETISSYLPSSSNALTQAGESGVHRRVNGSSQICISLGVDAYNSGITTNELFLQYLAEHPLTVYYKLETPTETDITTASLVTEKGEAPLYYDDELIADCNETISSESGIFDAKIKLMDDETVYSQKIQLHVERKPQ